MAVDREAAKAALVEYTGLDDAAAERLLDAVLKAAEREALEVMAGSEPIPSSIVDARALRLRYICEEAGRALKPREIEVVFRVAPTTALAIMRRTNATYPRAVDRYLRRIVVDTANVSLTGDVDHGLRYEIYFDEPAGLEYAQQVLQRRGLTHDVRVRRGEQILDVPREIAGSNPLGVLGLREPK
jgi:hypothetical protein